jgi:hypothetical protein
MAFMPVGQDVRCGAAMREFAQLRIAAMDVRQVARRSAMLQAAHGRKPGI